jgi:hypothetical protein
MIPLTNDGEWLSQLAEIKPQFLAVLEGSPEYLIAIRHPEKFRQVLFVDGVKHYLFEYLPETGRHEKRISSTSEPSRDK